MSNASDTNSNPRLPADKDRERICPECNRRITIGQNGTEYGHDRGTMPDRDRCSKRPDSVDPRTKTWGDRDV